MLGHNGIQQLISNLDITQAYMLEFDLVELFIISGFVYQNVEEISGVHIDHML